ncbi:MAG: hypothetical protein JW902_08530 [Syntrophaceae bacterium]|nr:hypothetical protein [Syntrophaceae bacterium]
MRNPDKSRFIKAVSHEEFAEIPFFELQVDISIAEKILAKHLPHHLLSFELPVADLLELNFRMGNDMMFFSHIWRLGRKETKDEYGRIHYIDGVMKSPESLKKLWYPDLDHLKRRLDDVFASIDKYGFGIICQATSAPFVAATAMGYEDYWMNTMTASAFVHEFTKTIQEWTYREIELYLQYPIDGIKIGSAFVTNRGAMCSPEMLEEFETSYLRKHTEIAQANDKLIFLHIDGNVQKMMPQFISIGVDILNPIEPCGGTQDIYEMKKKYGDQITLCGNIDINGVLLNGTPQEVRQDVIEHIDRLAVGGGYVAASSHDIHQLIPLENFYALRDTVHDYHFNSRTLLS